MTGSQKQIQQKPHHKNRKDLPYFILYPQINSNVNFVLEVNIRNAWTTWPYLSLYIHFLKTVAFKCFGISTTAAQHISAHTCTAVVSCSSLTERTSQNHPYPYYIIRNLSDSLSLKSCWLLLFSMMAIVQQHGAQRWCGKLSSSPVEAVEALCTVSTNSSPLLLPGLVITSLPSLVINLLFRLLIKVESSTICLSVSVWLTHCAFIWDSKVLSAKGSSWVTLHVCKNHILLLTGHWHLGCSTVTNVVAHTNIGKSLL